MKPKLSGACSALLALAMILTVFPAAAFAQESPLAQAAPAQPEEAVAYDPGGGDPQKAFEETLQAREDLAARQSLDFYNANGEEGGGASDYQAQWRKIMGQVQEILNNYTPGTVTVDVDCTGSGMTVKDGLVMRSEAYGLQNSYRLKEMIPYHYESSPERLVFLRMEFYSEKELEPLTKAHDRLISIAGQGKNDLEKALLLHDQIVLRTGYNYKGLAAGMYGDNPSYGIAGVLLKGAAVCDGYAKTYAALLADMGLRVARVTSTGKNHAWNMVWLDGDWYHVDATWDDPGYYVGTKTDILGVCRHEYFLASSTSSQGNHGAADCVAIYDGKDIFALANSTLYDNAWWKSSGHTISLYQGNWYSLSGGQLSRRSSLTDPRGIVVGSGLGAGYAMMQDRLFFTDSAYPNGAGQPMGTAITQYRLSPKGDRLAWENAYPVTHSGLACYDGVLRYGLAAGNYTQEVGRLELPAAPVAAFEYEENDQGGVTITGYLGAGGDDVVIPGIIRGLPVTAIGEGAFSCSDLVGVTFPDSLRSIGKQAFFRCNGLTKAVIPGGVTAIGEEAFEGCTGLTICGEEGSYAQGYAAQNKISFAVRMPEEILPREDADLKVEEIHIPEAEWTRALVSSTPAKNANTAAAAADLTAKLQNGQAEVRSAQGEVLTGTQKVGTGCVVVSGNAKAVLVVLGDVDGDGASDSGDLLGIRRDLLNVTKLEGAYRRAGQVSDSNRDKVTSDDLLQIRRFLLNVISDYAG